MDIKTVQEHSKQLLEARQIAWNEGILDARGYGVQLTKESFLKLISSGEYKISLVNRKNVDYPFEASFVHEGTTYFTVFTETEYQQNIEILGGIDDESITRA